MFFDLENDPGRGNLSVRAYFASVIGPRRIAHGKRSVKNISRDNPTRIASQGSGVEAAYVEVWLPQSSIDALGGNGVFVSFSSDETTGQNGFQLLLSATQRYAAVLIPDDQLYAQAVRDATGAVLPDDKVAVIVSTVVF